MLSGYLPTEIQIEYSVLNSVLNWTKYKIFSIQYGIHRIPVAFWKPKGNHYNTWVSNVQQDRISY